MKGFGIYVKNDLLDPKHVEKMGIALWLYLWFLDKMTSVSENGTGLVLGGKPITYENDIEPELGISRRTYTRWLNSLANTGYVSMTRTPRGVSIKVHKAEKIFGSKAVLLAVEKQENVGKSDAPHLAHHNSDAPHMSARSATSGTSDAPHLAHPIKTIQLDNTKTERERTHSLDILDDYDVRRQLRNDYWQINVDWELEKIKNWVRSKNAKRDDWIAAARLWLAREVDAAKAKGRARERKATYCINCGKDKSAYSPCRTCGKK